MMQTNRMLLIVDPQIDFISGTLPVPGAEEAMKELATYIQEHDGDYCLKVVTTDWHPYHHHSFEPQGGQWPVHCVQNTVGAAIHPSLVTPLYTTKGEVKVLRKGVYADREEYSIFKNRDSSQYLQEMVSLLGIQQIDLCGIAGDICVLNTLKDGVALFRAGRFKVLHQYSPSLDGGKALNEYVGSLR